VCYNQTGLGAWGIKLTDCWNHFVLIAKIVLLSYVHLNKSITNKTCWIDWFACLMHQWRWTCTLQ
jgi:hypothetical protein